MNAIARKTILITCLSLSGLMILDSLNLGHATMMFLLAGVIPGTSVAISADSMMAVFALLIGFVLARIASRLTRPLFKRLPTRLSA